MELAANAIANANLARWFSAADPAQRAALLETLGLLAVLRPREEVASLLLERLALHLAPEQAAVLGRSAGDGPPDVLATHGSEPGTGRSAAIWRAACDVIASGKGRSVADPHGGDPQALLGAVVPIARAGEVLGVLWAAKRAAGVGLPESDLWLLESLASHAAIALENAGELQRRADRDALTGIANHGRFWSALARELERADRYASPLSVVLLDLDGFKSYNDALGHLEGDRALAEVASVLAASSRASDTVARYGGEEFAAILPQTSLAGALAFAHKAIAVVRELRLEHGGGPLTVSAGAAQRGAEQDPHELVRRADAALYRAKAAGGDCVVSAS